MEADASQMSMSRDVDDDKMRNTNSEIKSRCRQLQKKCQGHEDEIRQLKQTIKQMKAEVINFWSCHSSAITVWNTCTVLMAWHVSWQWRILFAGWKTSWKAKGSVDKFAQEFAPCCAWPVSNILKMLSMMNIVIKVTVQIYVYCIVLWRSLYHRSASCSATWRHSALSRRVADIVDSYERQISQLKRDMTSQRFDSTYTQDTSSTPQFKSLMQVSTVLF